MSEYFKCKNVNVFFYMTVSEQWDLWPLHSLIESCYCFIFCGFLLVTACWTCGFHVNTRLTRSLCWLSEVRLHVTMTCRPTQEQAGRGLVKNPVWDSIRLLRSWWGQDRWAATMNSFRCGTGWVHTKSTYSNSSYKLISFFWPVLK